MLVALQVLVRILDHHDGRIDHGADGNRNTTERHDIGIDTLLLHDDEGRQDPERERDNGNEGRAQVEQEHQADQRHDNELLDEFLLEVVDSAVNQGRAVVGLDDFDTLGESLPQFPDALLDRINGREGILAVTHHDNAARDFALAIEIRHDTAHLGPDLQGRNILEQHRRSGIGCRHRDLSKVLEGLQVTARTNHVFSLGQFDDRAADLLVGIANRHADGVQGYAIGTQLFRIHDNLVLAHHATDGCHLRHAGNCLQFILEKPVLQGGQLCKVVLAGPVDERIAVDPAHAGCIRPETRLYAGRQVGCCLVEIFEHTCARPVDVRAILEQHVDIGVTEERVAAHHLGPGHRQHGRGDRVGYLLLDDAR